MILLICNSNMFVPGVVTRVLKSPQEKFIIYTDMPGMEKFFNEMEFPNAKVLRYPNSYTLRTLSKTKKYMLGQLKPYTISQIEFYHTEGGHLANWIVTKYSKKSAIVYRPPFSPMPLPRVIGFRRLKLKILNRVLYNFDADPLLVGKVVSTSISPSFFHKNNVTKTDFVVDIQLNYEYLQKKIPQLRRGKKVVLLTGGIVNSTAIPEKYDKLNQHIVEIIGADKIVTKCHPLFKDEYGIEKELDSIPSYIPFNMIIPMFDIVISFASAALAEAADAGKKAISTAFLIPFYDMKRRQANYDALVSKNTGEKKVYYPKTLTELDALLTSI